MNQVYDCEYMDPRLDRDTLQAVNSRLFFQAGASRPEAALRPWQYVEMEYRDMGLTPPSYVPPLATLEDAEIWMCLDDRVNARMRLREESLAG